MIETTDHDEGSPPVYGAPRGVLVPVLLDGHRWAMAPPGDPVAELLVDVEAHVEGHGHAPR